MPAQPYIIGEHPYIAYNRQGQIGAFTTSAALYSSTPEARRASDAGARGAYGAYKRVIILPGIVSHLQAV